MKRNPAALCFLFCVVTKSPRSSHKINRQRNIEFKAIRKNKKQGCCVKYILATGSNIFSWFLDRMIVKFVLSCFFYFFSRGEGGMKEEKISLDVLSIFFFFLQRNTKVLLFVSVMHYCFCFVLFVIWIYLFYVDVFSLSK